MAEELTFHLADFEGPLELLLTLVQKHKMDLHNIPILELIDQYTRTVAAFWFPAFKADRKSVV